MTRRPIVTPSDLATFKNTRIEVEGDVTHVILHNTKIVSFTHGWFTLDSGGWHDGRNGPVRYTTTTKRRMNQVSSVFDLGFDVWQTGGVWFVGFAGKVYKFVDAMSFLQPCCCSHPEHKVA